MDNAATPKTLNTNQRRASSSSSTSSTLRQDCPAKKQHVKNTCSPPNSTESVASTPESSETPNPTLRRSSRQSATPNIEQRTSNSIPEVVDLDELAVPMSTFSGLDGNSTQRDEVEASCAKRQRRTCRRTPSVHETDDESLMDFNIQEPSDDIFEKMRKDREKAAKLLVKDGELIKAQNSWRTMQTRIADLEKKFKAQRNKNRMLLEVSNKRQLQSDTLTNDKEKLEKENFALQVKIRELEFKIQKKDSDFQMKNAIEASMKESMDKLQRESTVKEAECQKLHDANALLQKKLAKRQEEHQQDMQKKEEEKCALQRKNEELNDEVEKVKNQAEAFRVKFIETWKKGSGKIMDEMENMSLPWGYGKK